MRILENTLKNLGYPRYSRHNYLFESEDDELVIDDTEECEEEDEDDFPCKGKKCKTENEEEKPKGDDSDEQLVSINDSYSAFGSRKFICECICDDIHSLMD